MELGLIAVVLIVLFGASKLPTLARSMGSATGEFQKGRAQVEEELRNVEEPSPAEAAPEAESELEPASA